MTVRTRPVQPTQTARLVIVDDHELARAGLRSMLADQRGLDVVGEASDGRQALALCRRLRPELVLMDVRMPDLDGLAATRAIKEECPGISVVLLTMHENPDYLFEAIRAGAAGYVLKGATKQELIKTVRTVLRGESALAPDLAARLLRRLADEKNGDLAPVEALSIRERDVLRIIANGRTNQEIAQQLAVSVSTVKTHVEHIIAKLGVSDRTEAAVRAAELGLLNRPLG